MKDSSSPLKISDLRAEPRFRDIVADRVWRAWWVQRGTGLDVLRARVSESLSDGPVPTTLVAHEGGAFMGTAALIASDMDDRPHYTPWVAALWVDPPYRGRGIGAALVAAAARRAIESGHEVVYLCSLPENLDFYRRRGWSLLESDIAADRAAVLTFSRDSIVRPAD